MDISKWISVKLGNQLCICPILHLYLRFSRVNIRCWMMPSWLWVICWFQYWWLTTDRRHSNSRTIMKQRAQLTNIITYFLGCSCLQWEWDSPRLGWRTWLKVGAQDKNWKWIHGCHSHFYNLNSPPLSFLLSSSTRSRQTKKTVEIIFCLKKFSEKHCCVDAGKFYVFGNRFMKSMYITITIIA